LRIKLNFVVKMFVRGSFCVYRILISFICERMNEKGASTIIMHTVSFEKKEERKSEENKYIKSREGRRRNRQVKEGER